jgi:hypothetical protein
MKPYSDSILSNNASLEYYKEGFTLAVAMMAYAGKGLFNNVSQRRECIVL